MGTRRVPVRVDTISLITTGGPCEDKVTVEDGRGRGGWGLFFTSLVTVAGARTVWTTALVADPTVASFWSKRTTFEATVRKTLILISNEIGD